MTDDPNQPTTSSATVRWEYRVVHINIDNKSPAQAPDPKAASQKLGGTLSPEFITREFPQQYGPKSQDQTTPKHPAEQLKNFLNLMGLEGWELTNTAQIGELLMFFFKRQLTDLSQIADQKTREGV